jgi:hypothetical protein
VTPEADEIIEMIEKHLKGKDPLKQLALMERVNEILASEMRKRRSCHGTEDPCDPPHGETACRRSTSSDAPPR